MDSKNVDIRVQIKLLRNEFSPRPTPGENLFLTVFFHAGSYSGVHETKLDGDLAKAKYKNRMFINTVPTRSLTNTRKVASLN